jgi:hypothetical protein
VQTLRPPFLLQSLWEQSGTLTIEAHACLLGLPRTSYSILPLPQSDIFIGKSRGAGFEWDALASTARVERLDNCW